MSEHLNRLNNEDTKAFDEAYKYFCETGEWDMDDNQNILKINDLVEVPKWGEGGTPHRDWIIIGLASNNSEAIIQNISSEMQAIVIVMVDELKLQQAEALGTSEDQDREAAKQNEAPKEKT